MEEKKTIRVGIIGTGNWAASAHLPAFAKMGDRAKVVALCNHHKEKARRLGDQVGISAVYDNLEEMIAKEDLDVLDIITSRGEHFVPACAAIDHGLDILCEKPIGHTLEEARELVRRLEGKDLVHHVGFTFRYSPVVAYAKQRIQDGSIGQIYHVQGFEQNGQLVDEETMLPRRGFSKRTDSGALHGYGSHLIDLARLLCGEMEQVIGHEATYIKERHVKEDPQEVLPVGVDDSTIWLALFANGAQGVFQASKVAIGNAPGVELRIYGSKGALWIRLVETPEGFDRIWTASREDMNFQEVKIPNDFPDNDWPRHYFSRLVEDFVTRVENRDTAPGRGDYHDGLRCQEIMTAIERSFETKSWVSTHLD